MVTNGNGLGCLIMTAVVDQGFRQRLLTEPAAIMSDFDLTEDEQQALTSIRAGSLTEFASQLHRWLVQRDPLYMVFGEGTNSFGSRTAETVLAPERMNGHATANGNGHYANGNGHYANGKHDSSSLLVEVLRRPEDETALDDKKAMAALASQKLE